MVFDFPESSGVYQIRNLVDGKVYVGSAVNLKNRWVHHRKKLRKGTHHSNHLQRAWTKYGEDTFIFEVLGLCEKNGLLDEEQKLLDQRQSYDDRHGYNMTPTAYSQLGRRHSEESKRRISASMKKRVFTAEHRAALAAVKKTSEKAKEQSRVAIAKASAACVGRIESVETRLKKSVAHMGMRPTAATRKRMRQVQKLRREQERFCAARGI